MGNLQRHVPRSAGQLLNHVLDRPELVAAVRELSPTALARLIDRVGLEDAGELVALASTRQLETMFDHDLWRADAPGQDERFDPERFLLWLRVLGEAGEEFLAQRLAALPVELLTLAVQRLALVLDFTAYEDMLAVAGEEGELIEKVLDNSICEEWEEFRILSRDSDSWDELWSALLALDREDHDRLRTIFENCCEISTEYISCNGGLYQVLTADEALEVKMLGDRDDRRAAHGFISGSDARAFLAVARSPEQGGDERDAITHAYFRALEKQPVSSARQLGSGSGANVEALLQLMAESEAAELPVQRQRLAAGGGRPATAGGKPKRARAGAGSGAAIQASGRAKADRVEDPRSAPPLLERALAELARSNGALHATRMEELGYLANVLVAGSPHAGRRFRPIEALEAAIAICSLELDQNPQPIAAIESSSADRLFRRGLARMQHEIVDPARRALLGRCSPELQAEAQKLLSDDAPYRLTELVKADALGLSQAELDGLLGLAELAPFLTGVLLDPGTPPNRFIAGAADLDHARAFLDELRATAQTPARTRAAKTRG